MTRTDHFISFQSSPASRDGGRCIDKVPPALLADATWYGTLAAARNLSAHGIAITLASDSWIAPARWSHHVARVVSAPSSKEAARLLEWLLSFGSLEPGQVLYPTSDEIAWLIAANSESLSRSFRLYAPPIESLVRLLDKARLVEDAQRAGLDVPETRVPRTESELEWSARSLAFPLYVKPRAQVFGRGIGKGVRVNGPAELLRIWRSQVSASRYDAEVLKRVPDLFLPVLQSCIPSSERIYTVDGFVDETGELYATLACIKLLQRPRGSGAGIIFEHAESDPSIEHGLLRLFRSVGYFGVFDAEFIEYGNRKLLIDINPRFYNHMAFETDRGLQLPWFAYLAATDNRQTLKKEIDKAKDSRAMTRAYVHRLPTTLLMTMQKLASKMSREDLVRWRCWISENQGSITDPIYAADDPFPAVAEVAMEAHAFASHPRAYLRGLCRKPS